MISAATRPAAAVAGTRSWGEEGVARAEHRLGRDPPGHAGGRGGAGAAGPAGDGAAQGTGTAYRAQVSTPARTIDAGTSRAGSRSSSPAAEGSSKPRKL